MQQTLTCKVILLRRVTGEILRNKHSKRLPVRQHYWKESDEQHTSHLPTSWHYWQESGEQHTSHLPVRWHYWQEWQVSSAGTNTAARGEWCRSVAPGNQTHAIPQQCWLRGGSTVWSSDWSHLLQSQWLVRFHHSPHLWREKAVKWCWLMLKIMFSPRTCRTPDELYNMLCYTIELVKDHPI